jgi:hypothetical protein
MSSLQVDSISSMGGGHVDGAGKVVQYVETSNPDVPSHISTTSSSWVSTGITLSITPKLIGSKIFVDYKGSMGSVSASDTGGSIEAMPLTLFESGVQVLGVYGLGYLEAHDLPLYAPVGGQGVFTTTNLNPLEFAVYSRRTRGDKEVYPVARFSSYVLSATEIAQ